jgi:hypothetical protein
MTDMIDEDADPLKTGREAWLRNMRKVLIKKGYSGEALENRINVLLNSDVSRIASVIKQASRDT